MTAGQSPDIVVVVKAVEADGAGVPRSRQKFGRHRGVDVIVVVLIFLMGRTSGCTRTSLAMLQGSEMIRWRSGCAVFCSANTIATT